MGWLIAGAFYLLLVSFFLGAFALSRRADDMSRRTEQHFFEVEQPETTHNAIRIHRLVEVDKDHTDATASPLASDTNSDRRLAG